MTVLLPIAGFGAAAITAFYMFRLIFMTFHGKPKNEEVYKHLHESPKVMTIPLIVLSVLSLAIFYTGTINPLSDGSKGWFKKAVGKGNNYVIEVESHDDNHSHHIDNHYGHDKKDITFTEHAYHAAHDAHYTAMYLSLAVAFFGIALSALFYLFKKLNPETFRKIFNIFKLYDLSKNKFYVDEIYSNILYKPFMFWSYLCSKIDWDYYDQTFIDSIGKITLFSSEKSVKVDYNWLDQKVVDGFGKLANYSSLKMKKLQGGVVQAYILGGLVAIILITLIVQQI